MKFTNLSLTSLVALVVVAVSAPDNTFAQHNAAAQKDVSSNEPKTGPIDIKNLPLKITSYVSQNFEGYAIKRAEYDPLCGGANAIDVAIQKQGNPNYSLIFLLDGSFVQREEDIELKRAPAKVIAAAKKKYAAYKIAPEIELLTFSDKSNQFLLDITNESGTKEVIFRADGSLVCEQ